MWKVWWALSPHDGVIAVVSLARGSVRRRMPRSGTTEQLTLNLLDLVNDCHPGWAGGVLSEVIHLPQTPIEGRIEFGIADSMVTIDFIPHVSWRFVALGPLHVLRNDVHE
jgi:hypothetical protein